MRTGRARAGRAGHRRAHLSLGGKGSAEEVSFGGKVVLEGQAGVGPAFEGAGKGASGGRDRTLLLARARRVSHMTISTRLWAERVRPLSPSRVKSALR